MLRCHPLTALATAALLAFASAPGAARAETPDAAEAHLIVVKAEAALNAMRADPRFTDLPRALRAGRAVLIVPGYVRAGIGIGGASGTGVLLSKDSASGTWSSPAFFDMRSASLGPQLGYQKSDLVLVVANTATFDAILAGDFSLAADAGFTAGSSTGHTDANVTTGGTNTGVLTFMRSEGAYAGATIGGASIEADRDLNTAYYGPGATPLHILATPGLANADADKLRSTVAAFAGR